MHRMPLPLALDWPSLRARCRLRRDDAFSISIKTWGGYHIGIKITATGGTVQYDCAMGRIDEPIRLRDGHFDVTGVHWPGQGGPIGVDTTRGAGRRGTWARFEATG